MFPTTLRRPSQDSADNVIEISAVVRQRREKEGIGTDFIEIEISAVVRQRREKEGIGTDFIEIRLVKRSLEQQKHYGLSRTVS